MHSLTPKKSSSLFSYLLALTFCFIFFEFSFFFQGNKSYLLSFDYLSEKLDLTSVVLPSILFFIGAQLFVHLCFCILIWILTLQIRSLFSFDDTQEFKLGIALWLLGIITALLANSFWFPNSHFSYLIYFGLPLSVVKVVLIFALAAVGCVGTLASLNFILQFRTHPKLFFSIVGIILAGSLFIKLTSAPLPKTTGATAERPNIFIIGVDSLRPDFLGYFGAEKKTAFLDAYLAKSTVFANAFTPLARTFPSWVSILTGAHPITTGMRSNLMSQTDLNLSNSLPVLFQRHGYDTLYATDEVRFSNIDKNFGFDEVVTPPMGVNDFILGSFNDFPISNLIVNTKVGAWLFPYSYANRPVYFTYNPNTFLQRIQPPLEKSRQKPLFMAIHFCLTHHPYIWASLPEKDTPTVDLYKAAVQRSDQQVRDFFVLLKKYGLLDHAIVVLLSDHGEGIELPGDRITDSKLFVPTATQKTPPQFYPHPTNKDEGMNQSAGHGTDVLGLPQYHSLLAFRFFGTQSSPKNVKEPVSLLAIKPTLLDLAHIPNTEKMVPSLANIVLGKSAHFIQPYDIFLETDYSPDGLRTLYPKIEEIVFSGAQMFQADPKTARLSLRKNILAMIINSKQYANIRYPWILALYPQPNDHHRMPILVNMRTGQWTNDLRSPFAQNSPAASMLLSLEQFYGKEIGVVDNVR